MILHQRIKRSKNLIQPFILKPGTFWNATGDQQIKAEIANKTYNEEPLFSYSCWPARLEQGIQANAQVIELHAPMEELLTVAIDDTANTFFRTGITWFFCHNSTFAHSFILY